MTSLFSLHRKLYQWQLKKSSRYILSGLLSVSVLLLVVPMLLSTYQLYEDREDIFAILVGPEQRIAAEQLQETGFIEIQGRTFGDERLQGFTFLTTDGTVINPADATSLVLSGSIPRWIPAWLLRDPNMILIAGSVTLVWCLISVWLGLFLPFIYSILLGTCSWLVFNAIGLPKFSLVTTLSCRPSTFCLVLQDNPLQSREAYCLKQREQRCLSPFYRYFCLLCR